MHTSALSLLSLHLPWTGVLWLPNEFCHFHRPASIKSSSTTLSLYPEKKNSSNFSIGHRLIQSETRNLICNFLPPFAWKRFLFGSMFDFLKKTSSLLNGVNIFFSWVVSLFAVCVSIQRLFEIPIFKVRVISSKNNWPTSDCSTQSSDL